MIAALAATALLIGLIVGERRRERREEAMRNAFVDVPAGVVGPRTVLMVGAGAMMGAALLGAANFAPPLAPAREPVHESTVVLAVDVSRSMTVTDAAPDRFTTALMSAIRLTASSPVEHVGLVTFSGQAQLLVPPTTDRALITTYLEAIEPDMNGAQGSDLTNAIAVSLEALGGTESGLEPGTSSIVVLSDGEGFEEAGRRAEAATTAASMGVAIHWVTVGTERGGLVPGAGADALSRAAPAAGADLARATGGTSVNLSQGEGLASIGRALAEQRVVLPPVRERRPGRGVPVTLLAMMSFVFLAGELLLAQRTQT